MTPIKAKTLIPKVAELTGYPLDVVEKLITFYYKVVRENLSELKHREIVIEKFGNFYIKERAFQKDETKFANINNYLQDLPDSVRRETLLRSAKAQLERLNNVRDLLDKNQQKRDFFRLHKQNYLNEKAKNSEDLEGQVENT